MVQVVSFAYPNIFINDLNEATKNTNNQRAANKCQCRLEAVKQNFSTSDGMLLNGELSQLRT